MVGEVAHGRRDMGGVVCYQCEILIPDENFDTNVRDNVLVFFFQAEDGIRDYDVTGVQTCALPIFALFRASHSNFTL